MKKINIYFLIIILLNSITLLLIVNLKNKHQIYLRNLMFSEIIADSTISNENDLNSLITKNFKTENKENFIKYMNPKAMDDLSLIKNQYKGNDSDKFLAVSILKYLGDNPSGQICGVPSLGKVVFDVEKGIGCCSDYSKAWIFYAVFFELKVREVNSLNHTTVEFYDGKLKKWVWLDPFNRAQFSLNNELLNQYEARKTTLFEQLNIINLNEKRLNIDLENYEGYNTSQLSTLLWKKGINFIEVEEWDSRLRNFMLPKPIRQLILIITGVSPGWLMLTNDSLASYLRILKAAIYLLIAIYSLVNLYLISIIVIYMKYPRQALPIKA
ncbi:hypothetical protein [Polynucleobacter rarus]|uniref:hypothetical protein n=1 Tax=Polynucleobacter rarus TaxID=556055 RepID=UPI000D3E5F89|nr:hypothetical protein [Polynucleobacter rarus]